MILTAHQPVYLPWLGLFHKIALSDTFCFFDDVQYQPKSFNNRNQIKTNAGPIWLTVPGQRQGFLERSFLDIEIVNDSDWGKKHWRSIELNYKKAPFFKDYAEPLADIYGRRWDKLVDLNHEMLLLFLKMLGITVPVVRMKDYRFEGKKSDLVLDMCRQLGADIYIFGALGKDYADVDAFLSAGVVPYFQDYRHPVYPQLNGEFAPYMSVLDLLFNCGPDSLSILMSGNMGRADLLAWAETQRRR